MSNMYIVGSSYWNQIHGTNKEEAKQVYKKIKNKYEAYYCISYNSKRKEQEC